MATIIGKMNLGSIIEKLGNVDFSEEKFGLADMYMSATDIWLCDGIDGHHYISDDEDTYETTWSYLDPQYGWMREELNCDDCMMDKSSRGINLNKLLIHIMDLGCNPNSMWIVFMSDNTVHISIPSLGIELCAPTV